MNSLSIKLQWLDTNNELAYAFIRIFLGIALFIRGWIMISDPNTIITLAGEDKTYWWFSYITIAHLTGGLLMAVGLLTRLASLIQIPILIGAVFLIHLKQGLLTVNQSLELSVLVLVLLLIYFVFGAGRLSVDSIRKKRILSKDF